MHVEMTIETMTLTLTSEEVFADYLLRTLSLQCGKETRVVRQFHYTAWPDHGVPDSTHTTITILRKAKSYRTAARCVLSFTRQYPICFTAF